MYYNHSILPPMSRCHPLLDDFPAFLLASLPPLPLSTPPSGCYWHLSETDPGTCGHRLPLHLLSPGIPHFVLSHSRGTQVLLRAEASSPTVLCLPSPKRSVTPTCAWPVPEGLSSDHHLGPYSHPSSFPKLHSSEDPHLTCCPRSSPPLPHPQSPTPTCNLLKKGKSLVFNQCAPTLNTESPPKAVARTRSASTFLTRSFRCLADRGARLVQSLTLVLSGGAQSSPVLLSPGGKISPRETESSTSFEELVESNSPALRPSRHSCLSFRSRKARVSQLKGQVADLTIGWLNNA